MNHPRTGFTVIELVGVLAILAILLASIVGAYLGWGQTAAIDGAAGMLASGLSRARELAINRRETTGLVCGNAAVPGHAARGHFVLVLVTNEAGTAEAAEDLSPTNRLPGDVQFDHFFPVDRRAAILFTPDGRSRIPETSPLDPDNPTIVVYSQRGGRLDRTVKIHPLTGIASVE